MVSIEAVYSLPPDGRRGWPLSNQLLQLAPDAVPPAGPAPTWLQPEVRRLVADLAAGWTQFAVFPGIRRLERLGLVTAGAACLANRRLITRRSALKAGLMRRQQFAIFGHRSTAVRIVRG
ncbi:hypothetical protein [Dactylosporangium sp. CA-233914]|uniref:hypothetical protein n=1 Tax=Dactylosporangium sp. CA-233914 TaxID=3239934 RepID=UPI003D8CD825